MSMTFKKYLKFSDLIMFADDTKLFIQNDNLQYLFNGGQVDMEKN